MFKYFLCIYFVGVISPLMANNYCELCKNHTMCDFKNRSQMCGEEATSGISESEAEEIVSMHNFYRSKIANGSVGCGSPGPQPPAANMNFLKWDKDLAEVAQRWADQCDYDHDECRRDSRFQVGQNMFVSIGPLTVDWKRVIKSWHYGVIKFNKSTIDRYQVNINTNFYTQLAWANTKYIGCGRTIFETAPNNREKSLKYNEFISSTVNGMKLKKIMKNNPDSLNINTKLHRSKRSNEGFFGNPKKNSDSARGNFGIYYEDLHELPINDQQYYQANEYNMRRTSNYGTEAQINFGNSDFYEQPVQSNQQFDSIYNYNNPYSYLSEQPSFYPQISYRSNFPREYSRNSYSYPERVRDDTVFLAPEVIEKLNSQGSLFYFQAPSRTARSINSDSSINEDDDNYYDDDDDDMSVASESKHQAENEPLNRKTSNQEATTQHSTKTRKQILVCNYGPAGNVIDQPIYIKGKPCSKCPPNTTCKNGLCFYN